MMDESPGIWYTWANYQELKRAQRLIDSQLTTLSKAEACGIECQSFRDALQQVSARCQAIEQNFFTPPPKQ